ncbi:uncharacterized protein JN550_001147 [Neoarthrinium moseri]|uniref:uncharacterized protein n=1 Tax=Neoarthrinium moseri TaxID=1658444 RepID=UPI001FDCBD74|nr:uncharacterized protein JN550_001147 [Neoarthrinium moseri]KAI1877075.1 hypothetical protein JN550_001147 [Neoarthrinium moseri]
MAIPEQPEDVFRLQHIFERLWTKITKRRVSSRALRVDARFEDILCDIRDEDLPSDVRLFHKHYLPDVHYDRLLRAARVAKHPKAYEDICRVDLDCSKKPGLVNLSREEKVALLKEYDSVIPEPGMLVVILTVSLAALLQGHVQSSINGASLYREILNISTSTQKHMLEVFPNRPSNGDWILGITNATPFLAAAAFGCWMALPLSDRLGRRGAMTVAAFMVLGTSILMAVIVTIDTAIPKWQILLIVRIINGMGMGIKAVNTPMLASETAISYWRGTSVLAWQLWVAFGIMIGFIFNAVFSTFIGDNQTTLAFILGAPIVPSVVLLLALCICPESPRYYMRSHRYRPSKAYMVLKRLGRCELIALRDIYLLHQSLHRRQDHKDELQEHYIGLRGFAKQYAQLFSVPRLRNALVSTCIMALSQQLCGINVLAFYSGVMFSNMGNSKNQSMYYSIGFGAVNFLFGIPAWRTIDTIGRRKWVLATLLPMAVMMAGASASFVPTIHDENAVSVTTTLVAVFLFLHAALYSPGLGPVPFTLSAESFPLSHREVGCAFAISVNLFFAGLLTLLLPVLLYWLTSPGLLCVFAVLNLLSFVLVFLLVEETRQLSLEALESIFERSKTDFLHHQIFKYTPWIFKKYAPWLLKHWIRLFVPSKYLGSRTQVGLHFESGGLLVENYDPMPYPPGIESTNGWHAELSPEDPHA